VIAQTASPRRSNAWTWWLACCSTLFVVVVILVIAGAVYGGTSLYNHFRQGGFSCLPPEFPSYPGSTFGGETYNLNNPTPGTVCGMVFESKDSRGAVLDFYQTKLNSGDWRVVSTNSDTGDIAFISVKSEKSNGTVHVAAPGDHTEISVQLYS
jgi:hypothetical protein